MVDWAILGLLLIVAFFVFASVGRREVEHFVETHKLPNGRKINVWNWNVAAIVILGLMIAIKRPLWGILLLVLTTWGGPYIQYAMAWNFYNPDRNKGQHR